MDAELTVWITECQSLYESVCVAVKKKTKLLG